MKKQERHRLYELMLRLYKLQIDYEEVTYGFCSLLKTLWIPGHINNNIFKAFTEKEQELLEYTYYVEDLAELMEYKPEEIFYTCTGEETDNSEQFWFPISNTEIRIKILEECIEKTK